MSNASSCAAAGLLRSLRERQARCGQCFLSSPNTSVPGPPLVEQLKRFHAEVVWCQEEPEPGPPAFRGPSDRSDGQGRLPATRLIYVGRLERRRRRPATASAITRMQTFLDQAITTDPPAMANQTPRNNDPPLAALIERRDELVMTEIGTGFGRWDGRTVAKWTGRPAKVSPPTSRWWIETDKVTLVVNAPAAGTWPRSPSPKVPPLRSARC